MTSRELHERKWKLLRDMEALVQQFTAETGVLIESATFDIVETTTLEELGRGESSACYGRGWIRAVMP